MAKNIKNGEEFGEWMMDRFNVPDEPRQGFGVKGLFMIGRDSQGRPGIQMGGHFTPFSEFKYVGGGGKGGEDEEKVKGKPPEDKDIDFPVRRVQASMADIYRPRVQKTFKEGGLVRGAGKAQRGRGRGKMI